LVETVRGSLRSIDEALPWLIADRRAIGWSEVVDHLWLRVLDPAAALGARRYGGAGALVIEVDDPAGFAAGRVELRTDAAGRAFAASSDEPPDIGLGVPELSAIDLGGVRPSVLASAGRIIGSPETVALADRLFASERTPHLSIWF